MDIWIIFAISCLSIALVASIVCLIIDDHSPKKYNKRSNKNDTKH